MKTQLEKLIYSLENYSSNKVVEGYKAVYTRKNIPYWMLKQFESIAGKETFIDIPEGRIVLFKSPYKGHAANIIYFVYT
ncbi:MAG: hypothetical protein LUE98_04610 [Tannerellaceae bacterium]|nr:hypothetical protein [Tannerellaceae bacterium]